jgi:multicomponent Na+:H+ antiporter subunit D
MGIISNIYLLIFIPLIASLFCQITSGKKAPFYLAATTSLLLLLLSVNILPDILVNGKISNDFQLSILSLALEFHLDILSITFFLLILTLKIIILLFFRGDIQNSLPDKSVRNFYSVFLLHLFALSGIFTTNNIFNLFLYLEIYTFSFFAISSISNNLKLLKISFNYFCLSAASSLLIIFCFIVIYLTFGEVNFDKILTLSHLTASGDYWFIKSIFSLLALAFIFKFFPLWIYFEKIKSSNLLSGLMIINSLFIKSLIGIFLMIKFCYLVFGSSLIFSKFNFDLILLIIAIALIFYSALKLYKQKHLKLICAYLCLNNLGFIIATIALHNLASLQALFFYLLSFCLVNIFIFLFAVFLKRHFNSSSIIKISIIQELSPAMALPLKLLTLFIAGFPFSLLFFANWHLVLSITEFNFAVVILLGLAVSSFAQVAIAFKFIEILFPKVEYEEVEEGLEGEVEEVEEGGEAEDELILQNKNSYLTSFWLLIILIYGTILFAKILNNFSFDLASYLLSNTI